MSSDPNAVYQLARAEKALKGALARGIRPLEVFAVALAAIRGGEPHEHRAAAQVLEDWEAKR